MQLLLAQCRTRISSRGIYISCVYDKGKFANISVSEYKGKWVLLCFYPGVSRSSERQKSQQLLRGTKSIKAWALKFFLSV